MSIHTYLLNFVFISQAFILSLYISGEQPILMLALALGIFVILKILFFQIETQTHRATQFYTSLVCGIIRKKMVSTFVQAKMSQTSNDVALLSTNIPEADPIRQSTIEKLLVYVRITFEELHFSPDDIETVEKYVQLAADGIQLSQACSSAIQYSTNVSQTDLKHFAWNISRVIKLSGHDAAVFAHVVFEAWFRNTSLETTKRTLRETRSCLNRIPLFDKQTISEYREP